MGIEIATNMEPLPGGIAYAGRLVDVANADALKKLAKDVAAAVPNEKGGVAVLAAVIAEKPFVAIAITDGLVAAHQLDAGKWVKQVVAPLIKGGGGGQKNLAAAGGQDAQGIQPVIEAIRQQLTELA
jgi:alanyl-tRNA synthetase